MQNLHLNFDCAVVKSKVKISQNFVAFSEYINFTMEEQAFYFYVWYNEKEFDKNCILLIVINKGLTHN